VTRLHYFERVSSTMDVIHQLAAEGAPAGTAVVAGEQLQGRGSRGQSWHSPVGGLWLSVLFRPDSAAGLEVTSIRVGLVVAETVEPLAGQPVGLKWPNDLMLAGRKLGGVLCEARWQGDTLGWIAVGLGMNVRNRVPPELSSIAVSLAAACPDVTPEGLAGPVVAALQRLDLNAGRLTRDELARFARRDWLLGRAVREPLAGTVAGIQDDGALLVRPPRGADVPLRSGPVELAAVSHSR
jgi:BirA family transcriptional regulator, biotin operon repressor / biotin---[acetyl-CoA-carboxylase] ligase